MEEFRRALKDINLLYDFYDILQQLHCLNGNNRDNEASKTSTSSSKETIAQCHVRRKQLIEQFDQTFRTTSLNGKGRYYADTPAELCDRLISLTITLDNEIPFQNDSGLSEEVRFKSLDNVAHLHYLRSHLQTCLKQTLKDLEDGNAILPPHSELKKCDNPYIDPVTRKEVAIDLYAFAKKATGSYKDVNHILSASCNGHGASISYLGRDGTIRSSVLDRWAGTKYTLLLSDSEREELTGHQSPIAGEMHDLLVYSYGSFPKYLLFENTFSDWLDWLLSGLNVTARDIDLFVSSESNFVTCAYRLGAKLDQWLPNAQIVTDVEHHAVHQRQAFWQSGFQEAAVLTLDTGGESLARLNNHKLAGTISRMDRSGTCQVLREFFFPRSSAGLVYSIVNHYLGFSQGQEGKTMGLAPYGKPDLYQALVKHLRLYPDGSFDFLSFLELENALKAYEYERPRKKGADFTQKHADIAFAGQAIIEDIVVNAFKAALRLTGLNNLVYSGGLALNSVANEIANKAAQPAGLYIPPNPSDAGQALGCTLYAAYELAGWPPRETEIPEYIGPLYSEDEIKKAVNSSSYHKIQCENPDKLAARCIANGHIVARFSGPAEFGPRALGNRSILADPRRNDMKDYLNARVKHREGFRPFAPSVLLEHVSEWFDLDDRSPYMLRVVNVPQKIRDLIPAIVHVDGTARVQTVDRKENPGYWHLIDSFYEITKVPLVLNTSFNIAGKPIVETPQDAITCFESTEIDLLVLGGWIISKRPIDEFEKISR